jgi:cardiolipin synthase
MLQAIEEASYQILLEMYWFASDRIGHRFAEALMRARARGVQVAVVYDSIGSWNSDDGLFFELEQARIKVVEFNPIKPWRRRFRVDHLTQRDHRKILVVDGRLGFTGGINLAEAWAPVSEGGQGWRDTMVELRGPAVHSLSRLFLETWIRQGGPPLGFATSDEGGPPPGEQRVQVLGRTSFHHRREIKKHYLVQIYRAKKRVWIANAYFVPDPAVVRALGRAARRGVDVRVLVPGTCDVQIVRHASRAVWPRLIRRGVRIFEWSDTILHSKVAVVDGLWSTIGTYNLDYWSLLHNLEVNVAISDQQFAATLEREFERDFAASRPVDPAVFRERPLSERVFERLAYRARKLL